MVKRYVESYTGFLNYCSNKLGKSVKDLVIEFRNNGVEEDFLFLYKKGSCSSYMDYFSLLKENNNGVKRFTKAEKNN